jgi:hypothetical protein
LLALRNQVLNGGLPEWPMGADCKSAGLAFSGSNPLPTTKMIVKECSGLPFSSSMTIFLKRD